MGGVVFVNAVSGADDSPSRDDVARALPALQVIDVGDPTELPDLVREAAVAGHDPIGVAGGDGTIRCAAEALAGSSAALLAVPAGTRNHFARELGVDTLERAADALAAGGRRQVSVGFVNGYAFVNNASLGLYPALVRRRERSSLAKTAAGVKAAFDLALHGRPIRVEIAGERIDAWLVFIGNGRYGEGFGDLIERESLDDGILDVRIVRAGPRLARLRVVVDTLLGRVRDSHLVVAHETAEVSIGVEGRALDVAVDGEIFPMVGPLCFEARRSALTVVAPPAG